MHTRVIFCFRYCTFHKVVDNNSPGLELVSEAVQLMLSLQIETRHESGISIETESWNNRLTLVPGHVIFICIITSQLLDFMLLVESQVISLLQARCMNSMSPSTYRVSAESLGANWRRFELNQGLHYTGCKKFRIQTLRVCGGDKMKPFCYVINVWHILRFLAWGPWRVWRRMVLQKLLKMLGNYIIFIRDILPEILENVPLQIGQRLWFQHDGVPAHFSFDVREYLTMFSPIVGLGRVVQYSGHHVLTISLLWISLSGGRCVWCTRHR